MTSTKTHISWTDSTWNPTTGCTKVSAGCERCYAEALTKRLGLGGGDFSIVQMHERRIAEVRRFKPIVSGATLLPHRVFVNSMSDLMHDAIPDSFRDLVFDAMETMPHSIFQVLTKRAMTLGRYIDRRYKANGRRVPHHIWLGVSAEDNRVAARLRMLRRLKQDAGGFTAFVSVEPLIGNVDAHDYAELDWILIGGESGPGARPMDLAWARKARDLARAAGAAVWFKQFGTWGNNPLYAEGRLASVSKKHFNLVRYALDHGEREAAIVMSKGRLTIEGEKGGATLDGEVIHEHPPAYADLQAILSAGNPARQAAKVGGLFKRAPT